MDVIDKILSAANHPVVLNGIHAALLALFLCFAGCVQLIDAKELGGMLSVSPKTVFMWRYRDRWPFPRSAVIRIHRLLRFSKQAIESWIAAGCPRPEGENGK